MDNNFNNFLLTEEEQQKYFPLDPKIKNQWQTWVPEGYEISNMQIYEAMSRGIPIPTGDPNLDQEYRMFLNEFILTPRKKEPTPKPPITPVPPAPVTRIITGEYGGTIRNPWGTDLGINQIEKESKTEADVSEEVGDLDISSTVRNEDIAGNPTTNVGVAIPEESKEEYEKAFENELEKDEIDQLVRIVERKKANLLPIILAAIMALLLSCIRLGGPEVEKKSKQITSDVLSYVIAEDMSYEEAFKIATSDIQMGDEYYLDDGLKFNTNSLMSGDSSVNGVTKEMGKEFSLENKYAGTYPITGFAIVRNSDNKLLAYIEDFYTPKDNTKLSVFVDKTLRGTDIDYEDVRVEFHFGRTDYQTGERSRLGWIDDGNVVFDQEGVKEIIEAAATYEGIVKNFSGDHIVINTKMGEVSIPVKDSQGNYYKSGDIVVGSDNKEYQISQLDLTQEIETVETEIEKSGGKITFKLKDCNLLVAVPFLTIALAKYLETRKKNEKAKNNPYFDLIEESRIEEFIDEFQSEKGTSTKEHVGTITTHNKLAELIIEGYYKKTGIMVTDFNSLEYRLNENNEFIVYNKKNPELPAINITEYMIEVTKNGESIGEGWDIDAAEFFEKKGR